MPDEKNISKKNALPKISTGIYGLDQILEGGFPESRTTIISGGPGCGKSIIGLEFIYRNAVNGTPGLFVSFEEKADAILQNAMTLGWNLKELEKDKKISICAPYIDPKTIISGQFSIMGLMTIIDAKLKELNTNHMVIDAIDILLKIFNDESKERNEIYSFHNWIQEKKITTILTVKSLTECTSPIRYDFLDFMADCVIHLDNRVDEQKSTSRLRVIKYRGSYFGKNEYPYIIKKNGISIVPISKSGLRHRPLGAYISSGNEDFDNVLGGGYRKCSCVLISGITGSGKTTLANTFIENACNKNRSRILYIGFEESQEAIINNMLSPGIDLRPAIKTNLLQYLTALPESMDCEEHLIRAFDKINEFKPDHIIVDSISACPRMGSEKIAFDYIMRLLNFCKENDITCFFLNQTIKAMDIHQISGMEISSLIDTAILLGMIEEKGEINRIVIVLKSRGTSHSNQYREFQITNNGISFVDVYIGEGGVLTGTSRIEKEANDAIERRLREQEITKKRHEIASKEAEYEAYIAFKRSELEVVRNELECMLTEEDIRLNNVNKRGKLRDNLYKSEESIS